MYNYYQNGNKLPFKIHELLLATALPTSLPSGASSKPPSYSAFKSSND